MVSKFFPHAPTFFVREETERNYRVIVPMRASLAFVRIRSYLSSARDYYTYLLLHFTRCVSKRLPLPVFAMLQIHLPLPDDSCFIAAHPPFYVLLHSSCRFLSHSCAHSQNLFVISRSISLEFSPSFFPSLSDHLPFAVSLCLIPSHFSSSHVPDDRVRVVRSSREPPLFFHHQSPNRDLTYSQSRTATPLLAFATDMSNRPKIANKNTRHRCKLGEYR